jgi:hypothetical protein
MSTLWLEYEMSNVVFRDINLTMCDIPPRPALPRLAPTMKMGVLPGPLSLKHIGAHPIGSSTATSILLGDRL